MLDMVFSSVVLLALPSTTQGEAPACAASLSTCKDGYGCYPDDWKCDGDNDCTDGSDEQNCPGKGRSATSVRSDTGVKSPLVGYVSKGVYCRAKGGAKENEKKGRLIDDIFPPNTKYKNELDTYNCYDEHTRWKREGGTEEILLHGMTVSVTWKALERHEGEFNYELIDEALDVAKKENAWRADAGHGPVRVRLRVFTGWVAPPWLKSRVGVFKDEDGNRYPKFWEPEFADAYKNMMKALGKRYDDTDRGELLSEVAIAMCGLRGAETLNIPDGGEWFRNMVHAGYTEEKHKVCLHKQLKIHNKFWLRATTMVSVKVWHKVVITDECTDGKSSKKYLAPEGCNRCICKNGVEVCTEKVCTITRGITQEKVPVFTDTYVALCERILGERCRIGNTSVGLEDCVLDLANANTDLWFNSLTHIKNAPRNKHSIWAQSQVSKTGTNVMKIPAGTHFESCGAVTSLHQYLEDTPEWTAHFHSAADYVGNNGFVSYELPEDWRKVFNRTTNHDDESKTLSMTKLEVLKSAQEKMISNAKP